MDAKDLYKIAQTMFAMEKKKKTSDIIDAMHNERYQRTMTDEYPFRKKSRGRASVPTDVREGWKKLR